MKIYDWIVIGGGITGSALAYELSKESSNVLLLEKDKIADNATVYSYGGLAYWSGTTPLTKELGKEGIVIHRNLAAELDKDTEFCELDLLLTVDKEDDPVAVAQNFPKFAIAPEVLDTQQACQIEPLLNKEAISGALKLPHGRVNPQKTTLAYQQALVRNGGKIEYDRVTDLIKNLDRVEGVICGNNTYRGANTIVCAGGLTYSLLTQAGIPCETYFTHAQVIKTQPAPDIKLNTIVMPAVQQRFALEASAEELEQLAAWEKPSDTIVKSILDAGAVQQGDNSLLLGQISTITTNPDRIFDNVSAERRIRQQIARVLPSLGNITGTCHHCLVAFNTKKIATIGNLKYLKGVYLFSGFTSTIVFAPPLAKHFASWLSGKANPIIEQLIE